MAWIALLDASRHIEIAAIARGAVEEGCLDKTATAPSNGVGPHGADLECCDGARLITASDGSGGTSKTQSKRQSIMSSGTFAATPWAGNECKNQIFSTSKAHLALMSSCRWAHSPRRLDGNDQQW